MMDEQLKNIITYKSLLLLSKLIFKLTCNKLVSSYHKLSLLKKLKIYQTRTVWKETYVCSLYGKWRYSVITIELA